MKLLGTTTSPFVRRVRVVAAEVDEPVELVNTAQPPGDAELRACSPIAKVPVAVVADRTLFDSRAIIHWLVTHHGWRGALVAPRDPWHEGNLVNAIDGALESVVQVFLLRRDGHPVDTMAFATKQLDRAATILDWLAGQLPPGRAGARGFSGGLDLATLFLVCALDWMDFRHSYPTERHPALAPVRAAWREHPSLVATRPHA
jgi:glutathione S-transferase